MSERAIPIKHGMASGLGLMDREYQNRNRNRNRNSYRLFLLLLSVFKLLDIVCVYTCGIIYHYPCQYVFVLPTARSRAIYCYGNTYVSMK